MLSTLLSAFDVKTHLFLIITLKYVIRNAPVKRAEWGEGQAVAVTGVEAAGACSQALPANGIKENE